MICYISWAFYFIFRYRLVIKAGGDVDEFEFVMYGDVVKKFAPLACSELSTKVSLFGIYLWRNLWLLYNFLYLMFDVFIEWRL
jgi:hypothetical protein